MQGIFGLKGTRLAPAFQEFNVNQIREKKCFKGISESRGASFKKATKQKTKKKEKIVY